MRRDQKQITPRFMRHSAGILEILFEPFGIIIIFEKKSYPAPLWPPPPVREFEGMKWTVVSLILIWGGM